MRKRVVAIGAGVSGASFAERILEYGLDIELVIVDPSPRPLVKASLTLAALGIYPIEKAYSSPGTSYIKNYNGNLTIRRIYDYAILVDPAERTIKLSKGDIMKYDYLVIALGAEPGPTRVPGLDSVNINPWTIRGATQLLARLNSGEKPKNALVGAIQPPYPCPPAPIELAGLMSILGKADNVTLAFPEMPPLAKLGDEVVSEAERLLDLANVEVISSGDIVEVYNGKVKLTDKLDSFDLIAIVPPHRPPRLMVESGFSPENGWPVPLHDKGFRHQRYDDVFIIGEIGLPALNLPMSGFLASYAAKKAADTIAQELAGTIRSRYGDKAIASCYLDFHIDGAAIFCDFSDVLEGGNPHCHVVARGQLAGKIKEAYLEYLRGKVGFQSTPK